MNTVQATGLTCNSDSDVFRSSKSPNAKSTWTWTRRS